MKSQISKAKIIRILFALTQVVFEFLLTILRYAIRPCGINEIDVSRTAFRLLSDRAMLTIQKFLTISTPRRTLWTSVIPKRTTNSLAQLS